MSLGRAEETLPANVTMISQAQVLPDGSTLDEGKGESVPDNADEVGSYVMKQFQISHDARRNAQEDILLDCERAYRNKYNRADQDELAKRHSESGDSTVWVPYTRTKVNIATAKTYEKMLNTSDNPWSIQPDELNQQEKIQNIIDVKRAQASGMLQEDPEMAVEKLNEYDEKRKRERCDNMETEVSQQMNKGNAFGEIAKTILQQHYLGTGAAKFEISVRVEEKWTETSPAVWELKTTEVPFPRIKFISLFDLFFDPYALNVQKSRYLIERHVYMLSDIEGLKAEQDFDQDKIKEIILANPEGNHINLDYETTIRGVNEQDQNDRGSEGYFDVFEYWGEVAGSKLIAHGFSEGIEETKAYNVECWVCAGVTFKLTINPFKPQKIPYFVVPYQENTHTIYATGISEELFGVQDVINNVTRATINNAAFSHAPITELNIDMLKSGTEPPDVIKPHSLHLREGGDPKEPMMRFYQPTENSGVLYNVYDMFNKIGEDATGIASSSEESTPSAHTGSMSVSMSLSQKNILQRTVVANIDNYLIKPMIEMYYNFNMQWSDNEDIKVPAHVTANGVTSIIAKEMRVQQLMAFAQLTGNPQDAAIVDRKGTLEELTTALDQDSEKLILSDRQAQENNKSNSEAQQQAVQMEQKSVIDQINAENEGEMKQEVVKGDIAMRKQQLIEESKLMQIGAKQTMELEAEEVKFIQQLRMGQFNQANTERNTRIGQNNAERNSRREHNNELQSSAYKNSNIDYKNDMSKRPQQ